MNIVGISTLIRKELLRTFRVPFQTLGQPVVTTLLYFLVFGFAIGSRIGEIAGLPYGAFIMPGLIMMNVLITAFLSVSSALMLAKLMNTLSDLLVSPMSYAEIVAGYTLSAVLRALLVGALIFLTALFFVPFRVDHPFFLIVFTALVAEAFALLGLVVGVWADNFEQVSILPTFVITPFAFLGGIFYSVGMLPPFAEALSRFNPFFYMVNGMRYGFYSVSDVSPWVALLVVAGMLFPLAAACGAMFRTGYKIKS